MSISPKKFDINRMSIVIIFDFIPGLDNADNGFRYLGKKYVLLSKAFLAVIYGLICF